MLWGFAVFIILHVALTAYHQEPAKDFGNILPFVLSPLVLIAIIRNEPDPHYFWYGCATGALLSFIIALAQVYLLDAGRAYGFSNAITFGDTAIVLGTSALVGLFYGYAGFQHSYQRAYLLVGGGSGLISSLLSGSKGGWLSLVMVVVLLASAATRSFSLLRRLSIAFGLSSDLRTRPTQVGSVPTTSAGVGNLWFSGSSTSSTPAAFFKIDCASSRETSESKIAWTASE